MEELVVTNIFPQTEPRIDLFGQTLDAESVGDDDGHADPGETVELSVAIVNNGAEASSVGGTLSTDDAHVTISTASTDFGASAGWGDMSASGSPFQIQISPSCPDPHVTVFVLETTADGPITFTDTLMLFIGDTPGFSDDMESGPGNWTHKVLTSGYVDEWHLETNQYHSGGVAWKAGGPGSSNYADLSDGCLITPPFLLPDEALLHFWHYMIAERDSEPGWGWDGGCVMISSGDGNWTLLEPDFPTAGYPDSIVPNVASPFEPGAPCWSGMDMWEPPGFDLSAYSGVVQLMFRFGSDGAVTEEGWYVDDVEVFSLSCCEGFTGNVDDDPEGLVDIGDLTELIKYLYVPPNLEPVCLEEANVDGDEEGLIDIGDLTALIVYLYVPPNPVPASCQ